MTASAPKRAQTEIRSLHYRDLEVIKNLAAQSCETEPQTCSIALGKQLQNARRWYGFLKFLSFFPNPHQHYFCVYVAERMQQAIAAIQVSPFNSARSTWRVDRVLVGDRLDSGTTATEIGSQLLRHCFETVLEARTWLLEVKIDDKATLALYRQNGFQPLAQMTYWAISPALLAQLARNEPNLPNLSSVSNADAKLLYQLDTVSMPPLLRQVFDRHINDFKRGAIESLLSGLQQWLGLGRTKVASSYVFEPQRKAAIGYFRLELCDDGSHPHQAQLTVHPAYTWLYPELLSQMARIIQDFPSQSLQLASADYQPEREEYLENLGARRIEHTLLMSRSVWHKIREIKPLEALQWSDVLQGLQPRTPIPTRISWFKSVPNVLPPGSPPHASPSEGRDRSDSGKKTPETD